MPKDKELILTPRMYVMLKAKHKTGSKRNSLICSSCKIPFKVNDLILKCSESYIHKSCQSKYRYDILEEPTEEELENFFIIRE